MENNEYPSEVWFCFSYISIDLSARSWLVTKQEVKQSRHKPGPVTMAVFKGLETRNALSDEFRRQRYL